jgi:hypothetical protein
MQITSDFQLFSILLVKLIQTQFYSYLINDLFSFTETN